MAHVAGAPVLEAMVAEFVEERLLRFLEEGAEDIDPLVDGAVQQIGNLYRCDRCCARGPLLRWVLGGSHWGRGSPAIYRL